MAVFLLTAECLPWDTRGSQRVAVPCTAGLAVCVGCREDMAPWPAKAIPALRALKHITNTGQTPTGLTIHRARPQAPHSPSAEQCRARQGTLQLLLLFGVHLPLFHFLPHWNGGLSNFSSHSHLGTSMNKLTPLLPILSERRDGKSSLLNLPEQGHRWWVRWILLSTRDWGGSSVKQNSSHHYEELPQNFFKAWCLCYLLIQSEQ